MDGSARFRQVVQQDALVALGVGVLLWLGSAVIVEDDLWSELPRVAAPLVPSPAGAVLLLGSSLPLVLRRIAPLAALAGCVTASIGLQAVMTPSPLPLGVLVAMCAVAVHHRPLVGVCAAATYLCLLAAGTATGAAPLSDDLFYDYLVSLIATVTLGYGLALGRMRAGLAERRSDELAREQEERTRTVLAQEQARIAREVHDIVAHDVSVIVAQAAAARRVLPGDDGAAETLRAIEAVGRDALDGLRRLVHLLRADGGEQPREPQPTLDTLPQLVAQVRRAGLPVELVVHGDARRLPGTVETNAYRIVQEALTNALKHAGGARATVVLDYGPDVLNVEVRDDGRGLVAAGAPPSRGSGFGLVGMQQRAALLRGRLRAGECESGGFLVTAELPLSPGT
jgi:signal transduction histidine kinase